MKELQNNKQILGINFLIYVLYNFKHRKAINCDK